MDDGTTREMSFREKFRFNKKLPFMLNWWKTSRQPVCLFYKVMLMALLKLKGDVLYTSLFKLGFKKMW